MQSERSHDGHVGITKIAFSEGSSPIPNHFHIYSIYIVRFERHHLILKGWFSPGNVYTLQYIWQWMNIMEQGCYLPVVYSGVDVVLKCSFVLAKGDKLGEAL